WRGVFARPVLEASNREELGLHFSGAAFNRRRIHESQKRTSMMPPAGQPSLGVEGGHAAGAGGGDGLLVVAVGDVAGGGNPFYTRVSSIRGCPANVAVGIEIQLPFEEIRVRRVADRQKHTAALDFFDPGADGTLQTGARNAVVIVAEDFLESPIPFH